MSSVSKVSIKDLCQDVSNTLVVAVVIATQKAHFFPSRRTANSMSGVWNLTIRDSIADYVNVTFWGNEEVVRKLEKTIKIGDVVDVVNARVQLRECNSNINDNLYRPAVTSPFVLVLTDSENNCSLNRHSDDEFCSSCISLKKLLAYPTKPVSGFRTIKDLQSNGSLVNGEIVDLLVSVKSVGEVKSFKSKTSNKPIMKRELVLFDQTHPKLMLTLWDVEMMQRAENWTPRETILFIADLRIEWSSFHHSVVGTIISKTVITENPINFPEVANLRQFANKAPLDVSDFVNQLNDSVIDVKSIKNVISVQKILDKMETFSNDVNQNFTAVVYGIITHFNLDGPVNVIAMQCGVCKNPLSEEFNMCLNLCCPVGNGSEVDCSRATYNIRVDLADHTGTVKRCRSTSKCIEEMLKVSPEMFQNLSDTDKNQLKWKYLLERCEARIIINPSINTDKKPILSIISCKLIDSTEAFNNIPQY